MWSPRASRRAFLGGAGAVLALPFLESLGGKAAQADDTWPLRLLVYYVPNGIHMPAWTPATTGSGYDLPPILAPLSAVKSKLLVLSGLANTPGIPDEIGDHAAGTGAFLTCRHVKKTEGADIQNGVSFDQLAAAQLGQDTRIASLQLGVDGGGSVGDCDSGYSCAYVRNISWASATQPLPKTVNPQVVFDLLFQGLDPAATEEEKARRKLYKKSVLDYVLADSKSLELKLGSTDRKKLDEYMTGVSELEKRLDVIDMGPACVPIDRPEAVLGYPEHAQIMSDLMVLAMQCDVTRVLTFMLGNAGSNRTYDFLGVTGAHHELSHHGGDAAKQAALQTIDTWEIAQFAYLLERMDAIEEGDGTLLDHAAVYFASEIEDGNSHNHRNLPVLLAGSCGGAFSTGRHVAYDGEPPLANLFLSLLEALGVPQSSFGDNGTGPLANL
jgi:hypothetical protein